jgi:hypothetical protein
MKHILPFLILINFGSSFGQDFSYPKINQSGKAITDFIPKNWQILDSTKGDLNKDKIADYALVIQLIEISGSINRNDSGPKKLPFQPRILIIALTNPVTKQLELAEQNISFILQHDDPSMEDPFQSIKIEKGILNLEFQIFYNMGSWYVSNTSYKFRYQNNNFTLIGADDSSFHRATHDFKAYSYNFLSKKWSLQKGNFDTNETSKEEWHNLLINELKTFKTFKTPYTWEVTKETIL